MKLNLKININESLIVYRKLKILPLSPAQKSLRIIKKDLYHLEKKEIEPVFNKPNIYLCGDICWFETIVDGKIRAFLYDKKMFLFNLHEKDVFRMSQKEIDILLLLKKINRKLLSKEQNKLLIKYKHEMEVKAMLMVFRKKLAVFKKQKRLKT